MTDGDDLEVRAHELCAGRLRQPGFMTQKARAHLERSGDGR
jgi:hypothetical protein